MKILISTSELEVLRDAVSAGKSKFTLTFEEDEKNGIHLIIDEEQADELRDLCGDYLSVTGFDGEYRPTEKGLLLEGLIDKLYVA